MSSHIEIVAATKENSLLLNEIINQGENDYRDSPYLKKGIYNPVYRMLIDEAKKYDLTAVIRKNIYLEIYSKGELISTYSPNTPDLSLATRRIVNNKILTKVFLDRAKLPNPTGALFIEYDKALTYFNKKKNKQVIKPKVGSGGKGVTAGVDNEADFKKAWEVAKQSSREIIVEDFIEGDEVRVFVLGGKVTAAICRLPAFVIGDGVRNVFELVEVKNKNRQNNPTSRIYPIESFDYLEKVLAKDKTYTPSENEYVRLITASNVGLGGESVNILKYLHPSIIELAESVWQAIPHATQLGLDIIIKNFTAPAENNASIIEVNADPAVPTPAFCMYGEPMPELPKQLVKYSIKAEHSTSGRLRNNSAKVAKFYDVDFSKKFYPKNSLPLQSWLIREAAYSRGLSVDIINTSVTLIRNKQKEVCFINGICGETRFSTPLATSNKQVTKELLSKAKISTPLGKLFKVTDKLNAWGYAKNNIPVVIKPLSGSGGKGVTTNITSWDEFNLAWSELDNNSTRNIIVEDYITGQDYRLICIGDKLSAVTQRIPAYVVGDGVNSINELIDIKNNARKKLPNFGSHLIKLTNKNIFDLKKKGIDTYSILKTGQYLEFDEVANIGSGGESIDMTDVVHPDWESIAVKIRKTLFNPIHVGIDLQVEDISKSPNEQKWAVLEVNSNPEFGLQHFPFKGKPRDIAGCLLDYIFNIENYQPEVVSRKVTLIGKVQGVGLRVWLKNNASLHSVSGYVENLANGTVQALLVGDKNSVDQLINKCWTATRRAKVDQVEVSEVEVAELYEYFTVK